MHTPPNFFNMSFVESSTEAASLLPDGGRSTLPRQCIPKHDRTIISAVHAFCRQWRSDLLILLCHLVVFACSTGAVSVTWFITTSTCFFYFIFMGRCVAGGLLQDQTVARSAVARRANADWQTLTSVTLMFVAAGSFLLSAWSRVSGQERGTPREAMVAPHSVLLEKVTSQSQTRVGDWQLSPRVTTLPERTPSLNERSLVNLLVLPEASGCVFSNSRCADDDDTNTTSWAV